MKDNELQAEFRGKLSGYFVRSFISLLLAALSGGLLFPFSYYMMTKYEMNNSYIDDKALDFKIKVSEIYWKFLGLACLVIVTVGIYIFFIPGAILKWKVKHIAYLEDEHVEDSEFRYALSNYSIVSINSFIVTVLSLGLASPLTYVVKHRAKFNYMYIEGVKFNFLADVKDFYIRYLIYYFLSLASAGAFKIVLNYFMLRYTLSKLQPYSGEQEYTKTPLEKFNDLCISHKKITLTVYILLLAALLVLAGYLIYLIAITYFIK